MVSFSRTQVVEGIVENGVLRPREQLNFRDHERVRITVQSLEQPSEAERQAAIRSFIEKSEQMGFRSSGPYPTRDELHERD